MSETRIPVAFKTAIKRMRRHLEKKSQEIRMSTDKMRPQFGSHVIVDGTGLVASKFDLEQKMRDEGVLKAFEFLDADEALS